MLCLIKLKEQKKTLKQQKLESLINGLIMSEIHFFPLVHHAMYVPLESGEQPGSFYYYCLICSSVEKVNISESISVDHLETF